MSIKKVQTFSPKCSTFSFCLNWTAQAGALCSPHLVSWIRLPGQAAFPAVPEPVETQPHHGNQENQPPSLSLVQMWKLIGVEEDTVLGPNHWSDLGVSTTDTACHSLSSRHAPPIPASSSSWRAERVIGEVHPVYAFPCSKRGTGRRRKEGGSCDPQTTLCPAGTYNGAGG